MVVACQASATDGLNGTEGLWSRDALDKALPNHASIAWDSDCRVRVRLQPANVEEVLLLTSAALEVECWYHIAINFGPPGLEVFVDGALAAFHPVQSGIDGNDNPIAVGASTRGSVEGEIAPVRDFLSEAALDELRISRARRAFQSP